MSIKNGVRNWRGRNFPPKKLSSRVQNSGYLYVPTPRGRKSIHRMVCTAWYGPPPHPKSECRHLNGRKRDNRPANLRWGTTAQNFRDRQRHEPRLKLNKKRVREIRHYLCDNIPFAKIAHMYNVGYHTIYLIAQGMTWRSENCGLTLTFRQWQRDFLPHVKEVSGDTLVRLSRKAKSH
ncbi:MAG: HNH endonuclease [Cyanobacteria bacterium REEB67]|nr:HNH endonuclease [Cyanobacteria bacterium REEB67]